MTDERNINGNRNCRIVCGRIVHSTMVWFKLNNMNKWRIVIRKRDSKGNDLGYMKVRTVERHIDPLGDATSTLTLHPITTYVAKSTKL